MSIRELSGPVIHIGVSVLLAIVFRLNVMVTVICGFLPDILDKPLSMLGIGDGRYIGHTLLFAAVVILLFTVWKRKYGLAALLGLASHFLLDLNGLIPWFYPFKHYQFSHSTLDMVSWLKWYFTPVHIGVELLAVTLAVLVVFLAWRLYLRLKKRNKTTG